MRYAPVEARYKVYVIDEVHMLSTAAFNALLKTLEEPPPHAKFIFATTEIRKVPVTILSRCQRFDLRRVEPEVLVEHLETIADREGAQVEHEGLALIARAAEGSVRDGLSLLDQAHRPGRAAARRSRPTSCATCWAWPTAAQTIALFEQIMARPARPRRSSAFRTLYGYGADPAQVMPRPAGALPRRLGGQDAGPRRPAPAQGPGRSGWRRSGAAVSAGTLSRVWQMLLKAQTRCAARPIPAAAVEMALIRLAYAADLPGPEEALKRLQDGEPVPAAARAAAAAVRRRRRRRRPAAAARPAMRASRRPAGRRRPSPRRRCSPSTTWWP